MTAEDFEQPADPAQFGTWLARKTRAEQQAKLDALSAETMSEHRPVHDHLTRGQRGLFGMSGQQAAAEVADRAPTVGSGLPGGGRPLDRLGGAWDTSAITDSPCPGRADLRYVDQPNHRPTGESPTVAWQRANQQ